MTKTSAPTATPNAATKIDPIQTERARIRAIITAPEADGRIDQAQHLAFETDLNAEAAIGILATAPKAPQTHQHQKTDLPRDVPGDDVAATLAALIAENIALKANGAALVLADAANVPGDDTSPIESTEADVSEVAA